MRLCRMLYAGMPRYAASRSIVPPDETTASTPFSSETNGTGSSRMTGGVRHARASSASRCHG
jgi:hypothetical protein